jgi:hypothetical protein
LTPPFIIIAPSRRNYRAAIERASPSLRQTMTLTLPYSLHGTDPSGFTSTQSRPRLRSA